MIGKMTTEEDGETGTIWANFLQKPNIRIMLQLTFYSHLLPLHKSSRKQFYKFVINELDIWGPSRLTIIDWYMNGILKGRNIWLLKIK